MVHLGVLQWAFNLTYTRKTPRNPIDVILYSTGLLVSQTRRSEQILHILLAKPTRAAKVPRPVTAASGAGVVGRRQARIELYLLQLVGKHPAATSSSFIWLADCVNNNGERFNPPRLTWTLVDAVCGFVTRARPYDQPSAERQQSGEQTPDKGCVLAPSRLVWMKMDVSMSQM